MKKIKIIISLLVLCVFINCNNVFASTKVNTRSEGNYLVPSDVVVTESIKQDIMSTPAINAEEKVYDFADILTKDEEDKLYKHVKNFVDGANMDYVLVTTSKNNKASASKYARDFYDYNDFGIGDSYDGVIFLVDMDTREFYMSTSGAAIKMYNNKRIAKLLDSVKSYFVDGDYGDGTIKFIEKLDYYASVGYPSADGEEPRVTGIARLKMLHWPSIFIFSIAATAFVMYILISNSKLARQANSSRHYLTKADVSKRDEIFMGKTVHHTARVDSSSSGGGSSISRGSSGRSHGGGGRSF